MDLLNKFLPRVDFDSYEDFYKNYQIDIPENFNFAFDVSDAIADSEPDKLAMVWCDDKGAEATFTFGEIKKYSNKAANFFREIGIKKGDAVMLVLKRRYEFWFCLLALHKIGAVAIPATHLLTKKDIIYRNNAADIKMIVSVAEDEVVKHIDEAMDQSPKLELRVSVGGSYEGWLDFDKETEQQSEEFPRPTGDEGTTNEDMCLLYFT